MEPIIIAAIIKTGGSIAKEILSSWKKNTEASVRDEKKIEKKLNKIIEKHYERITQCITPHCVKVLFQIESGDARRVKWIWRKVFPKRKFEREFTYRLRYLCANGLVSESMSWFRITRLGRAFLGEARIRKDYRDILYGKTS